MTEHQKFTRAMQGIDGAVLADSIDVLDRPGDGSPLLADAGGVCVSRIEFWLFGEVGAVVLVSTDGTIGVYRFEGVDGEDVQADIDRAIGWCHGVVGDDRSRDV